MNRLADTWITGYRRTLFLRKQLTCPSLGTYANFNSLSLRVRVLSLGRPYANLRKVGETVLYFRHAKIRARLTPRR